MPTVLIADDAAFMRLTIENILTEAGHEIGGEAENGAVAVGTHHELEPFRPDRVLEAVQRALA